MSSHNMSRSFSSSRYKKKKHKHRSRSRSRTSSSERSNREHRERNIIKSTKRHSDTSDSSLCDYNKDLSKGNRDSKEKKLKQLSEHSLRDLKSFGAKHDCEKHHQDKKSHFKRSDYKKHRSKKHLDSKRLVSKLRGIHQDKICKRQHSKAESEDEEQEHRDSKLIKASEKTLTKDNNEAKNTESIDFTRYKHSLGKIFFRDNFFSSISQRGSQESEEFWAFVKKIQEFQKRKKLKLGDVSQEPVKNSSYSKVLELPKQYDVQYKINLSYISKEFEDFLKRNRLVDYHLEKELTRERVLEFHSILRHYLDFQQKQKFQKLQKIRRDQKNLPIYQYKHKIIETLRKHQIVVVAGDTGCGKSTQVPQYLMEAGFEKIACTQPRRIACISLSKRVGYETLNEYGTQVAYQVRFEKTKTASTKILFLTEGLLLRQMSSDPLLEMYNVVVIDEVHERHIFTDFLLGVLKCVLRQRSDLKLVLMSATININLFSAYFHNAPIIKVPGRLYPIETEFVPISKGDIDLKKLDATPYLRIIQRIDHKYSGTERGDLLIFLSGVSEIMNVVSAIKAYTQDMKRWIVLPLHSGLSMTDQDKVFDVAPEGARKCIVSTNIAETSVTIDGVRFIVDSGKVKEMSYDPKFKMKKLEEFWISRASSEQRKGRAGRTGPGVCFRLYEESDYNSFQDFSTPEIQRVPLDSLVLQMISMGLPDARKFPFIEPPSLSSLEDSILLLKEQGALRSDESLTPIGQMLSMLPVDVVIGKILIMGSVFNMIDPILSVTSAMSVQSPFTNNVYTDHESTTVRKPLESEHGDPFTLLNAFDEWIQVKAQGLGTYKWCKRRAFEEQRFYEMTKLKRQFKDLLKDHHLLDGGEHQQQYLTSDQRRHKHVQRKRLHELRKEKTRQGKKKKFLSMEDEDYKISGDEENEDGSNDIKDLEFRLSNDLNQLQETSNQSRNFTLRDINLMKIILCSGLYPQVAIADDCNSYKRDSEQAFHTKSKSFVLLHPTSIFASQPDLLAPKDADGKRPQSSDLKGLLSSKHELLAFVSLLETKNKPYLVNNMRVPALQTVTLFSNSIDTNIDCTRLVCDEWLEFKFPKEESAEQVVSSVLQLRSTWYNLLKVRLQDTFDGIEEEKKVSPRALKLERLLASKLTEFLNCDVVYSMRRVHTAEVKRLYLGPGSAQASSDLFSNFSNPELSKEHPVKGGIQVTEYLTFNCLVTEESASIWGEFTVSMQRHWLCPQCNKMMVVSVLERLQHEAQCSSEGGEGSKLQEEIQSEQDKQTSLDPLRKSYFCPECKETLRLTISEILKHRKSHTL